MSFAFSKTRSAVGIHAQPVSVEVHLSNGLPSFTIVGLPETAVKESKDRVRSAIINSQFEFPCRRITVNLAPANLPKSGSGFDLPIAIGILAASGQLPAHKLSNLEFIGELALSGELRGVSAIIPIILAAHRDNQHLIMAAANGNEAAITSATHISMANHLREVCNYLCQDTALQPLPPRREASIDPFPFDWSDIKGQHHAKYAMIIAASGGHNVLLSGPPGSGKTLLAKRFKTILPELTEEQALECASINSVRGAPHPFKTWRQPPFRAPHHTASAVALVGGGNPPKPGEISLAHRGVLFLDELTEFPKQVLETLRQPLESGQISISRAAAHIEFPASFQLIAAMNPCPCGQWGNPHANCLCSPDRIRRYLSKLSAPFLDRIDMQITMQPLLQEELIQQTPSASPESDSLRNRVAFTQTIQMERQGCLNARLSIQQIEAVCGLSDKEQGFLSQAMHKLKLSARSYHRLLKVARTIADMREEPCIDLDALQSALSLRQRWQLPS